MTQAVTETPPFVLQRLDHVVLRTADVDRLVNFYQSLGCTIVRKLERMRMVQLAAGGSMIDIVNATDLAETAASSGNLDHFALRIEPFDAPAILQFCARLGIEAEAMDGLLLGADGYGPAVYIRDPDGNRVELKGAPERPREVP